MVQRFSTNFTILAILLDMVVIDGSLALIKQYYKQPFLGGQLPFLPVAAETAFLVFPLFWLLALFFNSVYDNSKTLKVIDEFTFITLGSSAALAGLAGILFLGDYQPSRSGFLLFIFLAYSLLLLWRVVARTLYKSQQHLRGTETHYLVLGAGPVGRHLVEEINRLDLPNYVFCGFLDDSEEKRASFAEVLGDIDQLPLVIKDKRVDHVFIALPRYANERITYAIQLLSVLPVKVSIIPDFFDLTVHNTTSSSIGNIPLLDIKTPALTPNQRLAKRVFDLTLTILFLVPALPVMAIIWLLVRLIDGSPVILTQSRVGENGRIIKIRKFRTMRPKANNDEEEKINPAIKNANDPRITKLGRWLRRSSLDELPQFFTVLSGEMSLVGPRPELPRLFEQYLPWQRVRLTIPQGITGWWQVNGRSDKPLMFNTEYDQYYIQNYSIWLDIYILLKTFWIVLRGRGAY